MLASSGFLKNIICPFYKSGLCERPHCHFKHSNDNQESSNSPSALFSEEAEEMEESETLASFPETPSAVASPTPKAQNNSLATQKQPAPSRSYLPISCIPQYKPTPLEELRKMKKTASGGGMPSTIPPTIPSNKRHIPYDPTKTIVQPRVLATVKDAEADEDSDCSAQFSDEEDTSSSTTDNAALPSEKTAVASAVATSKPAAAMGANSVSENLKRVFESINLASKEAMQKSCDTTPTAAVDPKLPQSSMNPPPPDTLLSSTPHPENSSVEEKEHSRKEVSDPQQEPASEKEEVYSPSSPSSEVSVNSNNSLKITCDNHQREVPEEKVPTKENEATKEKAVAPILKGKENKDAKEVKKNSEKAKSNSKAREKKEEKDEKKKVRERSSSKDSLESKEKVAAKDVHNVSSKVKDFKSSIKDKEHRKSKDSKEEAPSKSSEKAKQPRVEQKKSEKLKKDLIDPEKKPAKEGEKKKPHSADRPNKNQEALPEKLKHTSDKSSLSPDKKKHSNNLEKQKSSEKLSTENSKSRDKPSESAKTADKGKQQSDSFAKAKSKSKDSETSSKQPDHKHSSDVKISRQSSSDNSNMSIDRHNDSSHSSSSKGSQEKTKTSSKSTSSEKVKNSSSSSSSSSKKPHSNSHHSTSTKPCDNDKRTLSTAGTKRPKEESNNKAGDGKKDSVSSKLSLPKEERPAKIPRRESSQPSKTKPGKKTERSSSGEDSESEFSPKSLKRKNGQVKTTVNPELESILSALGNSLDKGDETLKECWEIFNEEELLDSNDESPNKKAKLEEEIFEDSSRKKRLAHQPELKRDIVRQLKPPRPSPFLIMQQRLLQVQQLHSQKSDITLGGAKSSAFLQSIKTLNEKKRTIQGANPNIHLLAAVNRKVKEGVPALPNDLNPSVTSCMTATKGTRRVAHTPAIPTKPRPSVTPDGSNRVPYNIRQKYLNFMIDEYLKLCEDEDQAYRQALEEETRAYARANNRQIYTNVACNVIQKLRRRLAEETGSSRPVPAATNDAVLGGSIAARTSFSIEKRPPKVPLEIEGPLLYKLLKPYLLTPKQLEENNYPLPHPTEPNKAIYPNVKISPPSLEKTCCRCQRKFMVDEEGDYVRTEECTYHWSRMYKKKIAGSWESRYNCCGMDGESDGCCSSRGHVWDGLEERHLEGYVITAARDTAEPGVYGLDCEMGYTTDGLELIRVSVVNSRLQSVYETLVQPSHPVLDYNTRFSGLTAQDLAHVTTRLHNVQAALLNMFSSRTVLVGHSLESDLRALKLIHFKVVDTSLVFPHRLGLPYKRSLRNLMAEFCNKIIQNDVEGHDSKEDASAAMELLLHKLKEDARRANR